MIRKIILFIYLVLTFGCSNNGPKGAKSCDSTDGSDSILKNNFDTSDFTLRYILNLYQTATSPTVGSQKVNSFNKFDYYRLSWDSLSENAKSTGTVNLTENNIPFQLLFENKPQSEFKFMVKFSYPSNPRFYFATISHSSVYDTSLSVHMSSVLIFDRDKEKTIMLVGYPGRNSIDQIHRIVELDSNLMAKKCLYINEGIFCGKSIFEYSEKGNTPLHETFYVVDPFVLSDLIHWGKLCDLLDSRSPLPQELRKIEIVPRANVFIDAPLWYGDFRYTLKESTDFLNEGEKRATSR